MSRAVASFRTCKEEGCSFCPFVMSGNLCGMGFVLLSGKPAIDESHHAFVGFPMARVIDQPSSHLAKLLHDIDRRICLLEIRNLGLGNRDFHTCSVCGEGNYGGRRYKLSVRLRRDATYFLV